MKSRFLKSCAMFAAVAVVAVVAGTVRLAGQSAKQAPPPPKNARPNGFIDPRNPPPEDPNYKPPMTAWGVPDISGRWAGASDIIHYSIEDPEGDRDEHVRLGGQRPVTGRPIIDPPDAKIPYQPWAMKFAKVLDENHRKPTRPEWLDPVARGFQEAFPRVAYGGPTIYQEKDKIFFFYGYDHAWRVVYMDQPQLPDNVKLWMGSSRAHWEGTTLVVNTENLSDEGWIQIIGGFHSPNFKVEERFTRVAANHMKNIITITDPQVYTQPWKLRVDMRGPNPDNQEVWEDAVWEGNRMGGLPVEFWGGAKKQDVDPVTGVQHQFEHRK